METYRTVADLEAALGQEIGPTEWFSMEQDRVDGFADDTEDHQWIHVDPVRAADGPYGATIAHGFLTLSLVPYFVNQLRRIEGVRMGINYGLDKVRFPSPVRAGSRIRARTTLIDLTKTGDGAVQVINRVVIEVEGGSKPACVADLVSRYYYEDSRDVIPALDWSWLLTATTIDELITRRAELSPDAPLLLDEHGASLTCAQFDQRVSRVAAALEAEGIVAGTRVAWQLPTRLSTILVLAALRRLDAVQAPIIPLYREREVRAVLATTAADVLLTPGSWRGFDFSAMAASIAADGGPAPRVVEIGHEAPEQDSAGLNLESADADSADSVRWIYFTSGSTGAPKGARHTDASLLATGLAFAGLGALGRQPGEVGAMGFPVAHVGGIEYLISALAGGFPVLLLEAFVPAQAVELFRRHGVTTTGGAPPFYTALLALASTRPAGERLIPTLRTLKGGGAPCPPDLVAKVADVLGAVLAHDYGMTEVPMIAVASPLDPPDILAGTDGRPIPANRLRFVDPAGHECPAGSVGEVQVSGAGVCLGYTDPEATEAGFTADGWFRTGDLGFLHPTGHLEVVGRLKDLIIRKGENIAPQEIEALLGRHPAVAEVAVIGLPDAERGERVCAVIVPAPGEQALGLEEVTSWLLEAGLLRQKLPEQVEVVEALPRTGLSKVAKAQLRELFSPAVT